MRLMRVLCLISLGGLIENAHAGAYVNDNGLGFWATLFAVSALGWAWHTVGTAAQTLLGRLRAILTGQPHPLPQTTPQALAAEMAALNPEALRMCKRLLDTAQTGPLADGLALERESMATIVGSPAQREVAGRALAALRKP